MRVLYFLGRVLHFTLIIFTRLASLKIHLSFLSLCFLPPTHAVPISIRFNLLLLYKIQKLDTEWFTNLTCSQEYNLAGVAWRLKMMCSLSVALHCATHSGNISKIFWIWNHVDTVSLEKRVSSIFRCQVPPTHYKTGCLIGRSPYYKSATLKKHRHRRNVTSHHFFSLLWQF